MAAAKRCYTDVILTHPCVDVNELYLSLSMYRQHSDASVHRRRKCDHNNYYSHDYVKENDTGATIIA